MPLLHSLRHRWTRASLPSLTATGVAVGLLGQPAEAGAQETAPGGGTDATFVGSEAERYLRLLQIAGEAAILPWSIRGLSEHQVARMAGPLSGAHPWARQQSYAPADPGRPSVSIVGPSVGARFNSAVPHGGNDGPVWAGRGLTVAGSVGIALRAGPVTATLAPFAFHAENRSFPLERTPSRLSPFADPYSPAQIDLPQRFGDGAYARVDPGESSLRLDAGPVSIGVSTAAQHWGPAVEQPIVLGNNAGGFPHAFVGTHGARWVGIGRLDARLVYGGLSQSAYSSAFPGRERRFTAGLVAAFAPTGLPGLEIGGARFYHTPWPAGGPAAREFGLPFQRLFKSGLPPTRGGNDSVSNVDNQLASVFARWVIPSIGAEVYGEYGSEDHNYDLLDFFLQPDHNRAYSLGFQKLWSTGARRWVVVRGEILNARRSHLLEVRQQTRFYRHSLTRQGHTHRGQILGAPDGYGGAAEMVAADVYDRAGRWTVRLQRAQGGEQAASTENGMEVEPMLMLRTSLGAERVQYLRGVEILAGVRGVWEMNRHFRDDLFNLNLHLGMRGRL